MRNNLSQNQSGIGKNFIPGRILSANDQLDKGPVILRTVTQTSSNELKERQHIDLNITTENIIYNALSTSFILYVSTV